MLQGSVNITYATLCKRWRQRRQYFVWRPQKLLLVLFPHMTIFGKLGCLQKRLLSRQTKLCSSISCQLGGQFQQLLMRVMKLESNILAVQFVLLFSTFLFSHDTKMQVTT